jgi:hypothetical protein
VTATPTWTQRWIVWIVVIVLEASARNSHHIARVTVLAEHGDARDQAERGVGVRRDVAI